MKIKYRSDAGNGRLRGKVEKETEILHGKIR